MRTLVPNNLLDRYDAYVELERTLEERTQEFEDTLPSTAIIDEETALRLDNLASERKEFSRLLARQDIRSTEQTQYKEMIEINELPDIPYKTQNEMIEFVSNFAIQKTSEGYDGIAVVNSELQNERYRHNFKNSISSIEAEFVQLRSSSTGLTEDFVYFRYGIPQSDFSRAYGEEQLGIEQSPTYMMPLNQIGLDKDEFLSADEILAFKEMGSIYNAKQLFKNLLEKIYQTFYKK
ncbi:MAG: hypothetical protein CM15mV96_160 [uncultured marine virus]|nr:MAG: hypothetical protein CM15mV96_160 [uncultured marine virus]